MGLMLVKLLVNKYHAYGCLKYGLSPCSYEEVERAVQVLEGLEGVPDPTSSSLIEGRWQLMFTTRPGTASPIQDPQK